MGYRVEIHENEQDAMTDLDIEDAYNAGETVPELARWPADGLVTDHVCENKACVNPAHLRELDNGANIQRAYARGDAAVEAQRARWRTANAKRRAKGGE